VLGPGDVLGLPTAEELAGPERGGHGALQAGQPQPHGPQGPEAGAMPRPRSPAQASGRAEMLGVTEGDDVGPAAPPDAVAAPALYGMGAQGPHGPAGDPAAAHSGAEQGGVKRATAEGTAASVALSTGSAPATVVHTAPAPSGIVIESFSQVKVCAVRALLGQSSRTHPAMAVARA
jgi:hypothetical protein